MKKTVQLIERMCARLSDMDGSFLFNDYGLLKRYSKSNFRINHLSNGHVQLMVESKIRFSTVIVQKNRGLQCNVVFEAWETSREIRWGHSPSMLAKAPKNHHWTKTKFGLFYPMGDGISIKDAFDILLVIQAGAKKRKSLSKNK